MRKITRLQQLFADKKAYVGYLTVGDGGMARSLEIARALIAGGVNMLELGVPFSDPVADGPVIQRAAQRAVANNTTVNDVLELARVLRQESAIPLVLFSYYNPLLATSSWIEKAKIVGLDAVLVVDLPYEEARVFNATCRQQGIVSIAIITPATTEQRLKMLVKQAQGFLYYACRTGTTGIKNSLPPDLSKQLTMIKQHTDLPVVVGFGVSDSTMVKAINQQADGVVVGSYFMKALEEGAAPVELTQLARRLWEGGCG